MLPGSPPISWPSAKARSRVSGSGDSGHGRYGLPDIAASCTREILELRSTPVAENTGRELWVRGPDRYWHRYAIFQDRIESVEVFGMSESRNLGEQTLPVG